MWRWESGTLSLNQDLTPKISPYPRVAIIYFPEITEVDVFFAIIQTELHLMKTGRQQCQFPVFLNLD